MKTGISVQAIEDVVGLACRAPSFHNSQPWRWEADRSGLHLFLDTDRLVATDQSGRQALISCGAALDHLRVAAAAAGFTAAVERYPDPANHFHLAAIDLVPRPTVTEADRVRAEAIRRRRTDRLPFAASRGGTTLHSLVGERLDADDALIDVIADQDRAQLVHASDLTDMLRMYDTTYSAELAWWTSSFDVDDGIPPSALVSAPEADRVDVGRSFPVTRHRERRLQVPQDQSTLAVISARDDTPYGILRCGETLSKLLLGATVGGYASCTLSHLTELPASTDIVRTVTGRRHPQVLVRIGEAPRDGDAAPPTPRRPITDGLRFRL